MLNAFRRLQYLDPADVLRNLRRVEIGLAPDMPDPVRHLRTNDLKRIRECREAALFCFGMSCRRGARVLFALSEAADYDFVTKWVSAGVAYFVPVQLKELVPKELNKDITLEGLLGVVAKYRSNRLAVLIHLNRRSKLDPSTLQIPELQIAGLWFLWGAAPDQSRWCLFGDVLAAPSASFFEYPA